MTDRQSVVDQARSEQARPSSAQCAQSAVRRVVFVVLLFGLVSCFGDIVYEGARSANGQYFSLLGASATMMGILYGTGEFLGYALRLVSGRICDETGRHWPLIIAGYASLIVVPFMGLTTNLGVLCALFLIERIGKALRNPPKDAVLSQLSEKKIGTGIVFGLQEALDQIGAFAGPMVFTAVFLESGRTDVAAYQLGYAWLFPGVALVVIAVVCAWRVVTRFKLVEEGAAGASKDAEPAAIFPLYMAFTFFASAGLVAFSIIGFHLKSRGVIADGAITTLYSVAMIVDAIAALVIGRLYDVVKTRVGKRTAGLKTLFVIPLCSIGVPFLALSESAWLAAAGLALYGIVLGTHETVMRSAIADLTVFRKRGTAYGIFNVVYGLGFLAGSSLMGILYDHWGSPGVGACVLVLEAAAFLLFIRLHRRAQ